jgi:Transglycosylase SLT domain
VLVKHLKVLLLAGFLSLNAHAGTAGGPADWSGVPGTDAWTSAAAAVVGANLASFERAADRELYCPGYDSAPAERRVTCWVRLISAVARYESGFDPTQSFQEASGNFSVGLLQLSTGECPNAETLDLLKDPVQNIVCGARKMAALIERDGFITSPDSVHGAAAYWSVLRPPFGNPGQHLGRRDDVLKITAQYSAVEPVN